MSGSERAPEKSYQVIARKYRPAKFSELISQEHVRTTLENAIRQSRIAHGYILSGQRGTGKTTVARIIARCLNCIQGPTPDPCGVCSSCVEIAQGNSVDVIEIDAASNRGINEMRELRDNVRYRPARDRYKVFIIDEAHQITTEAFNALLKTLEEPPEWVVFILCTTEVHKFPTTISSRCQQFSFRSVDFTELMTRMRWICEQEGVETSDDALSVLAQLGDGSVRDSFSALDQAIACCGNTLHADEIRGLFGIFSLDSLKLVSDALIEGSPQRMLELVQELERNGQNLQHFCRELARYFRNLLVAKISAGQTRLISASSAEQDRMLQTAAQFTEEDLTRYLQLTLDLFKDLQSSLQPRLHLEIGLLRLVHAGRLVSIEQALAGMTAAPPSAKVPAALPKPAPQSAPPRPSGPSPFERDRLRKVSAPAPAPPPPPKPTPQSSAPAAAAAVATAPSGDLKQQLQTVLTDLGMAFTADAVEHSLVTEQNGEIVFTTPKLFQLAMMPNDLQKAALQIFGKPMRVKVNIGETGISTAPKPEKANPLGDEEATQRALSNPDVQKFQELFPDAQVRAIRNLKKE